MTTDITELAQRMKAAAVRAKAATEDYVAHRMSITVFLEECKEFNDLSDGPDNVLALVEALESETRICATWRKTAEANSEKLEKAQHVAAVDWEAAASLNVENQELKRRIAELEDAEQKLCAANVTLDARAELTERQLAEMVSRTVTVKMPKLKMLEDYLAEVAVEERKAILLAVRMELHRALNAEGIKWEAE